LVGFEFVGWLALLLYDSCALYHPDALRAGVVRALGSLRALGNPAFLTTVVAALLLPQLSLSLLGGWLNGRYDARVTVPWPSSRHDRHEAAPSPQERNT
jgi:hypothetical protein